jgi:hypothetical protein
MYVLSYMNILFALIQIGIVYYRLTGALIFNNLVYKATIITETMLIILFINSALRDFINIDRNFVFHIILVLSLKALALSSLFIRDKLRYSFLSKVDFALYDKDFEALVMMFTLHELIESSAYDDS